MERAKERLKLVVPLTLIIIFVIFYFAFHSVAKTFMVMVGCRFRWSARSGTWLSSTTT